LAGAQRKVRLVAGVRVMLFRRVEKRKDSAQQELTCRHSSESLPQAHRLMAVFQVQKTTPTNDAAAVAAVPVRLGQIPQEA
jgi:hypothetical protein